MALCLDAYGVTPSGRSKDRQKGYHNPVKVAGLDIAESDLLPEREHPQHSKMNQVGHLSEDQEDLGSDIREKKLEMKARSFTLKPIRKANLKPLKPVGEGASTVTQGNAVKSRLQLRNQWMEAAPKPTGLSLFSTSAPTASVSSPGPHRGEEEADEGFVIVQEWNSARASEVLSSSWHFDNRRERSHDKAERELQDFFRMVNGECPNEIKESDESVLSMISDVEEGLAQGFQPRMVQDGTGGVYLMKSTSGRLCAVFKPRDEEVMGPNNPKGYRDPDAVIGSTANPMRKGFHVGDGATRERAIYLLDQAYGGFSGVPPTALIWIEDDGDLKEGSLQKFVSSCASAEDFGTQMFDIEQVHKIGILDVRVFNTDRHAANILLNYVDSGKKKNFIMTPIDHGFCLPYIDWLDAAQFDWLSWPQAKHPFSEKSLQHIRSIDVDADADLLRNAGIPEECVATMRICTLLLKIGAEKGLNLFDIGSLMQRDGDGSRPSELEDLVYPVLEEVQRLFMTESYTVRELADILVGELEADLHRLVAEAKSLKPRSLTCA